MSQNMYAIYCVSIFQKEQDLIQLEKEREDYEIEQKRLKAMEEEQKIIAQQEAYEKAAAEPIVVDNTPRPMPPEVSESLPTLVEDEEEKKPEEGNFLLMFKRPGLRQYAFNS